MVLPNSWIQLTTSQSKVYTRSHLFGQQLSFQLPKVYSLNLVIRPIHSFELSILFSKSKIHLLYLMQATCKIQNNFAFSFDNVAKSVCCLFGNVAILTLFLLLQIVFIEKHVGICVFFCYLFRSKTINFGLNLVITTDSEKLSTTINLFLVALLIKIDPISASFSFT